MIEGGVTGAGELIHRRSWPTRAELRTEAFDYIEFTTPTANAA